MKCQDPSLFAIVKQIMIHGSCGNDNLTSPCMNNDNKICSKNFPMVFKVALHLKIFKNSNFFLLNFLIIYVVSNLKKVVWMKKF